MDARAHGLDVRLRTPVARAFCGALRERPQPAPQPRCRKQTLCERRGCESTAPWLQATRSASAIAAALAEPIDVEAVPVDDRIPVTLVTGFLGSGKTTLLNKVLKDDHGKRIAVIENEFGEIDIDSELVAFKETLKDGEEQILMLNNGCLCCTVRDDLIDMLGELIKRRSTFDQIVIETTGLANPKPIIETFQLVEEMASELRLDGVVTLVDAKHAAQHLDEVKPDGAVNEALEQVAYADRIVLNKTDLVTEEEAAVLEARLRGINGLATITRASRAAVPSEYVLAVGGFDLERFASEIPGQVDSSTSAADHAAHEGHGHEFDHTHSHGAGAHEHTSTSASEHLHAHEGSSHGHAHGFAHSHRHDSHGHEHSSHDHHHDDSVTSVSIQLEGEMDLDHVNEWLGALLDVKSEDLYRFKGILAIRDFPQLYVFQGVHGLFSGEPGRAWRKGEPRVSKMVFIGRDLEEDVLREGFQECILLPTTR